MGELSLTRKEQRAEWNDLHKAIKDGNDNRNKIAHYGVAYDVLSAETRDGATHIEMDSKLQPSRYNYVSRLIGRTPDREEHSLSEGALKQYVVVFDQLEGAISQFTTRFSLPPPPSGLADALSFWHDPKTLGEYPLTLPSIDPPEPKPSG